MKNLIKFPFNLSPSIGFCALSERWGCQQKIAPRCLWIRKWTILPSRSSRVIFITNHHHHRSVHYHSKHRSLLFSSWWAEHEELHILFPVGSCFHPFPSLSLRTIQKKTLSACACKINKPLQALLALLNKLSSQFKLFNPLWGVTSWVCVISACGRKCHHYLAAGDAVCPRGEENKHIPRGGRRNEINPKHIVRDCNLIYFMFHIVSSLLVTLFDTADENWFDQ